MQYAVLDVVRVGHELERIRPLAGLWLSLYRGTQDAQQEATAPCLVGYEPADGFATWFSQAITDRAGIGVETAASPDELRKHLRRFLLVELAGDETIASRNVYFRYYDPAILRVFLPTCDQRQLTEFFGPIQSFTAYDSETTQLLRFTRQEGRLQTYPIDVPTDSPAAVNGPGHS